MAALYWVGQAIFVGVFVVVATSDGALSSAPMLIGAAAIQVVLVGWRLWLARAWPWLALVPPASTLALWYGLGFIASREMGGDGLGLLAAMISFAWCALAYVALALWAGTRTAG